MSLLVTSQLETNFREKKIPGGLGGQQVEKNSAECPCRKGGQLYTRLQACRSRAVISVLRACESAVLVYWGATNQRETCWSPVYRTKIGKEMECMMQERLRQLGLFSLKMRRFKVCGGCITAALSYLWGGCREDRARIFSEAHRPSRRQQASFNRENPDYMLGKVFSS